MDRLRMSTLISYGKAMNSLEPEILYDSQEIKLPRYHCLYVENFVLRNTKRNTKVK